MYPGTETYIWENARESIKKLFTSNMSKNQSLAKINKLYENKF